MIKEKENENEQEQSQECGTFSNKELFEFMAQFNCADEMKEHILNKVLEYRDHIETLITSMKNLYEEYLFPNIISAVQVKVEVHASHEVIMSAIIGDRNSDAIASNALKDMYKQMEEA